MEQYLGEFTIQRAEYGSSFIECDEETAEFLDGAFIDWCHRGYLEPCTIREDGRVSWRLTPWGKEHVGDIIKVKDKDTLQ